MIFSSSDHLLNCRAAELGQEFRNQLQKVQQKFPHIIREIRGRGLLNAVDLSNKALYPASAYDICIKLKERGILAKPTHDTIIRLAPPLSIRYDPFTHVWSCFGISLFKSLHGLTLYYVTMFAC
jgi:acetylornithine/succinyldiaminopimelate/putrescine aminotransferase